jgi:ring-1,2-phenylacetyl-CoA epoxidase subunit PaaD
VVTLDALVSMPRSAYARAVCSAVLDPELPVVTIADLGILRDVIVRADGHVDVVVTPTYSGCPATEVIKADVLSALRDAGFDDAAVHTVRSPAWTTDWITEAGRRKLADHGIAPPSEVGAAGPVSVTLGRPGEPPAEPLATTVACPRCGSAQTRLVSQFGSTACQSMHQCLSCLEPFDRIKPY